MTTQKPIRHQEIRQSDIGADPELSAQEKETTITFPGDTDFGYFHSNVPTTIKWFLSVEESEITDYRLVDNQIVAVTGKIPKAIIKFQGNARKSTTESGMVSYGEMR